MADDIVDRLRDRSGNCAVTDTMEAAAVEIEGLRAALEHAIARMSDLEYHWHGGDFWGPIAPYTATGKKSLFRGAAPPIPSTLPVYRDTGDDVGR